MINKNYYLDTHKLFFFSDIFNTTDEKQQQYLTRDDDGF
jgi:hypothetical protein